MNISISHLDSFTLPITLAATSFEFHAAGTLHIL